MLIVRNDWTVSYPRKLIYRPMSLFSMFQNSEYWSGSSLYLERVTTVEASERRLILKGYKPNEKLADAIAEDQASKGSPEEILPKQQSSVHKETVKHVVRNSCRSSSMSGHISFLCWWSLVGYWFLQLHFSIIGTRIEEGDCFFGSCYGVVSRLRILLRSLWVWNWVRCWAHLAYGCHFY